MDEEFPDQGVEGQDEDLDAERSRAGAPAAGGELRLAGGPTQGPPTGDDRVDAAVAGLSRLAAVPAEEHVAVLEEVYGRLRDILGEVNEGAP